MLIVNVSEMACLSMRDNRIPTKKMNRLKTLYREAPSTSVTADSLAYIKTLDNQPFRYSPVCSLEFQDFEKAVVLSVIGMDH